MLGGQQIRAFHALHREAHRQGRVMNLPPTNQIQKFPGGYVQNPTPGLVIPHGDFHRVQTTLDFKSLYPSLMRQFGLDYCNFKAGSEEYQRLLDAYAVWNLTVEAAPLAEKAAALYKKFKLIKVDRQKKIKTLLDETEGAARALLTRAAALSRARLEGHALHRQALDNVRRLKARKSVSVLEVDLQLHLDCFRNCDGGILPSLIERYMAERKRYKKLMKAAYKEFQQHETSDPEKAAAALKQHAQYDSAQLAVKIMVNSLFGFTGVSAEKGMFPLNILAATTTCAGRWVIKKTAALSQTPHTVPYANFEADFYTDKAQFEAALERSCENRVAIFTEMIYGDTDSIMPSIEFKKPSPLEDRATFEGLLEEETERLNRELRSISKSMGYDRPHLILEFEKYGPMLVKGPKMYAIYKYEPGKAPKMSVSGLKPARRDNAMLLNKTYEACLKKRMIDNDRVEALLQLSEMILRVQDNKVCLEDYEITTSIGRNYKNPNCLQMRIKKKFEEHGKPCPAGTRVGYVVGKGKGNVADKVIPAEFAQKEDVDRAWYLREHLRNTFIELFSLFGDVQIKYVSDLFQNAINIISAEHSGMRTIQSFFKRKAET